MARTLASIFFGALLASVAATARAADCCRTVSETEAMITTEVPARAAPEDVAAVLTRHGIEHSDYVAKERALYGIIRGAPKAAVVRGSIQLTFTFDAQRRLERHAVNEVFTGP